MVPKTIRAIYIVFFLSSILTACSVGMELDLSADKRATTVSVSLEEPSTAADAVPDGARLGAVPVYVYIQVGSSSADARLYGPLSLASDSSVTTGVIPAGSYSELYVIRANAPKPDISPILRSEPTQTFASALRGYADRSWPGLSAISFGTIRGATIEGGKTTSLRATLIPLAGESVSIGVDGVSYSLPPSPSAISRRFIRLENVGAGLDPSLIISRIGCSITNLSSAASESIGTVSLLDGYGSVIAASRLAVSPLNPGQSRELLADYPAESPRELFLYVEYQGTGLALAFDLATIDGRTARFEYYVAKDGANGSGASASSPMDFASALTAISANAAITAARSARIILTEDIELSPETGYRVTKPIRILSSPESVKTISFGGKGPEALFIVGDAVASGALTLENARIVGGGKAQPGNGALILVSSGTFTMASGSELADNVVSFGSGGAVRVAGPDARFIMNSGSIRGCAAPSGGGLSVVSGSFSMVGGDITGCAALTGSGGAVSLSDGSVDMAGGTIADCRAIGSGGAISAEGGSVAMSGGSIVGCSAFSGGGVSVSGPARFVMNGSGAIGRVDSPNRASALSATGGGAVAITGGARFSLVSGSLAANEASALGGAIFVGAESACEFLGGSIAGNSAALLGGGAYVAGTLSLGSSGTARATLGGASLADGNKALQGGGAYVAAGGRLTVGDCAVVRGNVVSDSGGGAYVASLGILDLSGADAASISGNRAGKIAGGAFLAEKASLIGSAPWSRTIVKNETVVGSERRDILPDLARQRVVSSWETLSLALAEGTEPVYAVLTSSVACNGTLRVTGSCALGSAGADVELRPAFMDGPLVEVSGGNLALRDGIALSGVDASIPRSYPLVVVANGSLTLCDDARIVKNGNRDASIPGGGVYLNGGSVTMLGGSIGGDSDAFGNASPSGAGVFVERGTFAMRAGGVSHNRVAWGSGGGAGIRSVSGDLFLYGGSIDHNDASKAGALGGGVLATGGLVRFMPDSTVVVSANSARSGGGAYIGGQADIQMLGGTVGGSDSSEGNRADSSGGGVAIASVGRAFEMANALIANNRADGVGGGISLSGSDVSVSLGSGSRIRGNEAAQSGGGVFFAKGSVSQCSVSDSTAIVDNHVSGDNGLSCGAGVFIDSLPQVYAAFLDIQANLTGNTDASSIFVVNITKVP